MVSRGRAWADTRFTGLSVVAATPLAFDLLQNAPTVDTLTTIRVIGDLTVQYTPNSTIVDSLSVIDIGIGVSSVEAFAVSNTAGLPNPSVATNFPPRGWLYVATRAVSQQAESVGVVNQVEKFEFDVRGMRKVDKGVMFIIIEQNDVLVGGSMRISGRIRVLCLT